MEVIKKSVFTKVYMILLVFIVFPKLYAQQEAQFTQLFRVLNRITLHMLD